MKTKKVKKSIKHYYQTDNDWHNKKVIDLIADIKENGNFESLFEPLEFHNMGVNNFPQYAIEPLSYIEQLEIHAAKFKFDEKQVYFLLSAISNYIQFTDWEEDGVEDESQSQFIKIFEADIKRKEKDLAKLIPTKPEINNLRDSLKEVIYKQLEELPQHLEGMTPKERYNVICKLMPFVLPRANEDKKTTTGFSFEF